MNIQPSLVCVQGWALPDPYSCSYDRILNMHPRIMALHGGLPSEICLVGGKKIESHTG